MDNFTYHTSLVVITDQDIIDTLLIQGEQPPEYNIVELATISRPKAEEAKRFFELRVTPRGQAVIAFLGERAGEHYHEIGGEIQDNKHMALRVVGAFSVEYSILESACYLQLQRRGEFSEKAAKDKLAS